MTVIEQVGSHAKVLAILRVLSNTVNVYVKGQLHKGRKVTWSEQWKRRNTGLATLAVLVTVSLQNQNG
jgi:hypothetical protein